MPEMPEVETIRRSLQHRLEGRQFTAVDIRLPRLIKRPVAADFPGYVLHRQIITLARRGKYLLLYLEGDMVLVIHLRMTGKLMYATACDEPDHYTHIIFHLDNGDRLFYADTRTLGTIYALEESELWRIAGLTRMGPEPLSDEFTFDYFSQTLRSRKGRIKALLLNQDVIGGLGNIYVDESLAIACIDPDRGASTLTPDELERLYNAINKVIGDAIHHGGTTFRDYRDGEGQSGSHQHHLHVYGRAGQPCHGCGSPIARKESAGRGTHYCPHCQK